MCAALDETLALFGEVEVVGHALTPRLFDGGDATPAGDAEAALARLAAGLHGRFGPRGGDPP
jgi:hypothetical protein